MQVGSLVVTEVTSAEFIKEAMILKGYFTPNPPSPNQIYTVKALFGDIKNEAVFIELEELQYKSLDPNYNVFLFAKAFKEVQPPMKINIEELINNLQPVEA